MKVVGAVVWGGEGLVLEEKMTLCAIESRQISDGLTDADAETARVRGHLDALRAGLADT